MRLLRWPCLLLTILLATGAPVSAQTQNYISVDWDEGFMDGSMTVPLGHWGYDMSMALDYAGRSVGFRTSQPVTAVKMTLVLDGSNGTLNVPNTSQVRIFVSSDNVVWTEITGWTASSGPGSVTWTFPEPVTGRYWKYHSLVSSWMQGGKWTVAPRGRENFHFVLEPPRDTTPPAPPMNLQATVEDGSIRLAWDPPGDPDVALFRVYRDGALIGELPGTSHVDTVPPGTYSYTVTAVDASGNESTPAGPVSVTVVDSTPPPAPLGLTARVVGRAALLTWDPVPANDLAGYRVYRDGDLRGETRLTRWEDQDLPSGRYTYEVRAVDLAGNVSQPASVQVRVEGTPLEGSSLPWTDLERYVRDGLAINGPVWLLSAAVMLGGGLLQHLLTWLSRLSR